MAKSKNAPAPVSAVSDRDWEVEDALRTLTKAYDIVKDEKMMAKVKKLAGTKAKEMSDIAGNMSVLAKRGLISDKQAEKVKAKG